MVRSRLNIFCRMAAISLVESCRRRHVVEQEISYRRRAGNVFAALEGERAPLRSRAAQGCRHVAGETWNRS